MDIDKAAEIERYKDLVWQAAYVYFTTWERDDGFVNFLGKARWRLQRRLDKLAEVAARGEQTWPDNTTL